MSGTLGTVFLLGGFGLRAGRVGILTVGGPPVQTPTERPPARMTPDEWALTDTGQGGILRLEVLAAPDPRGRPITGYDYRLDDGPWTPMGRATPGAIELAGLTDGTAVTVALRAVNALGPGLASATKAATPTGAPAGFELQGATGALTVLARSTPSAPTVRGDVTYLQITG